MMQDPGKIVTKLKLRSLSVPCRRDSARHVYSHDKKYCLSVYCVPVAIGGTEETKKEDRQCLCPCPHGAYIQ